MSVAGATLDLLSRRDQTVPEIAGGGAARISGSIPDARLNREIRSIKIQDYLRQ